MCLILSVMLQQCHNPSTFATENCHYWHDCKTLLVKLNIGHFKHFTFDTQSCHFCSEERFHKTQKNCSQWRTGRQNRGQNCELKMEMKMVVKCKVKHKYLKALVYLANKCKLQPIILLHQKKSQFNTTFFLLAFFSPSCVTYLLLLIPLSCCADRWRQSFSGAWQTASLRIKMRDTCRFHTPGFDFAEQITVISRCELKKTRLYAPFHRSHWLKDQIRNTHGFHNSEMEIFSCRWTISTCAEYIWTHWV